MVLGLLSLLLGIGLFIFGFSHNAAPSLVIGLILAVYGIVRLCTKCTGVVAPTPGKQVVSGFYCTHLSGLPLGEVRCFARAYDTKIVFKKEQSTFELPYEKIVSAEIAERSKLVGASAGSAVAGAIMFGALGAIIASRPKNKKEDILIITYVSDDENKTIVAAVDISEWGAANKAVNAMKKNITVSQNVVL
ncbi:MAG: hypothetical protein J6A19_16780 [Oscillospiraceae bacterium]|nr:hypothetical protein [Oscillospiraceae bacterium]